MQIKNDLTQKQLKELFNYDPLTGVFTRKKLVRGRGVIGEVVGTNSRGYLIVKIYQNIYLLHRLAWLYVYGCWPTFDIDHINGIKNDNRIKNLRDVEKTINQQNRQSYQLNNLEKLLGVSLHKKTGKFRARIKVNGKAITLGYYETPHIAHQKYLEKKRQLHEGCTI